MAIDFPNSPTTGQQFQSGGTEAPPADPSVGLWRFYREAFRAHRADAKRRGIPFLFTFEEWCEIWERSGKWDQRGRRRGQYCMSRPGDKGPYAVDNVCICLAEENLAERNRNYRIFGRSKNPWLEFKDPAAAKEKKRQSMIPIAARRARDALGRFKLEGNHGP